MIILILLLVWVVALTPLVLRKISEAQVTASVDQFDQQRRLLGRIAPGFGRVTAPRSPVRGDPGTVRAAAREPSPEARRAARARHRLRLARRRRTLGVLASVALGTFVLGAIPPLRVLWDLTVADLFLCTGYVGLLVHFRRVESGAGPALGPASLTVVEGGAGRGPAVIAPLPPARPAFVILEASR